MKRVWTDNSMCSIGDPDIKKVALVERNFNPSGVALVNPNAVGRKTRADLMELAKEIDKADTFVKATACNKLQVIAEQIRFLQHQAQNILEEAKRNNTLHHAACNFKKVTGNIYHLYRRQTGQEYFSILSPDEWPNCPHEFVGSYKLEYDQSWTPFSKIESRQKEFAVLNKILETSGDNILKITQSSSLTADDFSMEIS